MPQADWLISGLNKHILPARENIMQIKFLGKILIIPYCNDGDHSPSEFYCPGEANYPLRFKVKIAPNKTTVRKMLQTLFLQHFNGFIKLLMACFFLALQI
jgi:hypothetical protein